MLRDLLSVTAVFAIFFSVQIGLAETCNENSSFEILAGADKETTSEVIGLAGILNLPSSSIVLQSVDLVDSTLEHRQLSVGSRCQSGWRRQSAGR